MTIKMKPQFIMSQEDIDTLEALPPNFPETHLTKKQKDTIDSIYHKYVSRNNVKYNLVVELYTIERKQKWPGGEYVSKPQAQLLVLQWLEEFSKKPELTAEQAAEVFFNNLITCEANRILVKAIYQFEFGYFKK